MSRFSFSSFGLPILTLGLLSGCTAGSSANSVVEGFFSAVNKSNFETAKVQYLSTVLTNTLNSRSGGHDSIQDSFQQVIGRIDSVNVQGTQVQGATATAYLTKPWGEKWRCRIELVKEGGRQWKISDWHDPERVGQEHLAKASQQCWENLNAASNEYQAALAENPKDASILHSWGLCCMSRDPAAAEKKINEALRYCADFCADEYFLLAVLYEKQGKLAAGEASAQRAIGSKSRLAITPEQARAGAYSMLAELYVDGSKFDQAIGAAQKALTLSPDEATAMDALGWAYYRKGDRAQALKYLS
jgi:tetratricopeptide (TPR) repeat protein